MGGREEHVLGRLGDAIRYTLTRIYKNLESTADTWVCVDRREEIHRWLCHQNDKK